MTTKKKGKKQSRSQDDAPAESKGAPAGRGGAAMGRTVGLPYGGARARKRKAGSKSSGSKTK